MKYLPLKLSDEEYAHVLQMIADDNKVGYDSVADFFRLHIHREWNRRRGLPKPKPWEWQGVHRIKGWEKRKV